MRRKYFTGKPLTFIASKHLTQLTTKRDYVNKEMQTAKQRHDHLDEELFELCGSQDLEIDLASLKAEIQDLRDSKGRCGCCNTLTVFSCFSTLLCSSPRETSPVTLAVIAVLLLLVK